MEKLIQVVYDECKNLLNINYALRDFSVSFDIVGNSSMARRCQDMANEICSVQDKINKALGEALFERIQRGEDSSLAILKVALAGVKLGREINKRSKKKI